MSIVSSVGMIVNIDWISKLIRQSLLVKMDEARSQRIWLSQSVPLYLVAEYASNLSLNCITEFDSTTFAGNLLQLSATRFEMNIFLLSHLVSRAVSPCFSPLIPLQGPPWFIDKDDWIPQCQLTVLQLFKILKIGLVHLFLSLPPELSVLGLLAVTRSSDFSVLVQVLSLFVGPALSKLCLFFCMGSRLESNIQDEVLLRQ